MGLQRNQCSDGLLCNQIRSTISMVEFSLIAMELANALPIKFRRGCSVLEARLGVDDAGFVVSLTYRRLVAAFRPDLYSAARFRGAGGMSGDAMLRRL